MITTYQKQVGDPCMSTKVWDVTKPRGNWERQFAKMQYQLIGLNQALDIFNNEGRKIKVK